MKKLLPLLFLLWPLTAHADPKDFGYIVSACGTLPAPYTAGGWGNGPNAGLSGPLSVDINGTLCTTGGGGGGGGTSSNFSAAFPAAGTAMGIKNGANMVPATSTDGTSLDVNCVVGCVGGTQSNATSGLATSATNGKSVAWLYGFNGATWDQLQVDGSKFLKVILQTGSAVIGHVITDTGSTTAVTGNVTVVQPTGTNLHAVLDTTSTTAVTQATAANLNAAVVGIGTAGSASGGVLTVQGVTSMTPLLDTPQASENHIGEAGSNQTVTKIAQTVTAAAYSTGNALGGLMTVTGAARVSGTAGASGTGGLLQSVTANLKSAQTGQIDVFIFTANPTGSTCTDKTAFVLAAADFDKVVGVVHIADWTAGNTASIGQAQNLAMPYTLASATSIFACAVTRSTPTFGLTTDLSFNFDFLRD